MMLTIHANEFGRIEAAGMHPALSSDMKNDKQLRALEFEFQDLSLELAITFCLTRCELMIKRIRDRAVVPNEIHAEEPDL